MALVATAGCDSPRPPSVPSSPAPAVSRAPVDLAALEREASANPDDAKALARYGSARAEAGDAPGGIALLRRAVAKDPALTAAWHNLGLAAERQGWLDLAAEAYDRVVAARPDHAGQWVKLGYIQIALGRYNAAEAAFRRAVTLEPRSSEPLVALASSHYAAFRFDEALVALRRAAVLNPRSVAAHANAAAILLERSKPADAETEIRAALRLEPDTARYHLLLGRVLIGIPARRAEAERALTQALALQPAATEEAEANYLLGVLAREAGRADEAWARWRRARALDPGRPETLQALGRLLRGRGGADAREGQTLLQEYIRLQRLRDRERELRQKVEERPHDGAARHLYGQLLLEQGNLARAVWELREAARLRPADAAARQARDAALRLQGRSGL